MAAVMNPPSKAVACGQLALWTTAVYIVQQDETFAIAKVGIGGVGDDRATSNLLAHHSGISCAPVIITHCSPAAPVVDFHPALAAIQAAHQSDWTIPCSQKEDRLCLSVKKGLLANDSFLKLNEYQIAVIQGNVRMYIYIQIVRTGGMASILGPR